MCDLGFSAFSIVLIKSFSLQQVNVTSGSFCDLLPFTNILELLVINHSSAERRNILVPLQLKLSCVLAVLQLAWVSTSRQLRWITQSGLALYLALQRVSRYLQFQIVLSFNIRQGLKCQHIASPPTLTMRLLCSRPTSFLNHQFAAICKGRIGFPNQLYSGILKDGKVIFLTEFKTILSQSRGILEPEKRTPDPRAPLAFGHSFSRQSRFLLFRPLTFLFVSGGKKCQFFRNFCECNK